MEIFNISEHNLTHVVREGEEEGILITKEAWNKFKNLFGVKLHEKGIVIFSKNKEVEIHEKDRETLKFFAQLNKHKNQLFKDSKLPPKSRDV